MNAAPSPVVELGRMTTLEAARLLKTAKIALIPVGSTEQHGGNMTMNTDTKLAEALSRRVAERLYPHLIVLPAVPVGISYHHMGFAGSMTLSPQTLQAVLFDYMRSFMRHGIRRFVLMNGHGGNQAALSAIAAQAKYELGAETANLFYWNMAKAEIRAAAGPDRYGHACEIEASFGLYLDPSIVKKAELQKAEQSDYPLPWTGYEAGAVDYPYDWTLLTRDGSFGDATKAGEALGEQLIDIILERIERFMHAFMNWGENDATAHR